MREISLSVANFEAVCVRVSGMADATGWHKCSPQANPEQAKRLWTVIQWVTVGQRVTEKYLLVFFFFF